MTNRPEGEPIERLAGRLGLQVKTLGKNPTFGQSGALTRGMLESTIADGFARIEDDLQRRVLIMRFGSDSGIKSLTDREIAENLKLSVKKVRALENWGLIALRGGWRRVTPVKVQGIATIDAASN